MHRADSRTFLLNCAGCQKNSDARRVREYRPVHFYELMMKLDSANEIMLNFFPLHNFVTKEGYLNQLI